MRTNHHAHVGALEEGVQVVSAKVDHVVLLLGIANEIVLEAIFFFVFVRVRPEKIDDALMLLTVVAAKLDLVRPWNLLDALNISHSWADTTVAAEDFAVLSNGGSKRKILEDFVDLCEATVRVIDILSETSSALGSEAEVLVDVFVFVVATKQNNLLGVLQFKSHQEADDLKRVMTLVDVVAEEQVVVRLDITVVSWHSPQLKEAHELDILTMQITEDLHGRPNVLYDGRLSSQNLRAFVGKVDNVLALARELCVRLDVLTFLGLQERLEEHLAKCLIRVLVNLGTQLFLVGVQLLWLFCELINRDLTHDKREIFSLRVLHVALVLRGLCSNVSLIRKLERAIHVIQRLLVLLDGILLVFVTVLARFFRRLNFLKKTIEAGK